LRWPGIFSGAGRCLAATVGYGSMSRCSRSAVVASAACVVSGLWPASCGADLRWTLSPVRVQRRLASGYVPPGGTDRGGVV
jgi:hypothetical protein